MTITQLPTPQNKQTSAWTSLLVELKEVTRYATTNYPGTLIAALIAVMIFFVGSWDTLNRGVFMLGEDTAVSFIQTLPDVRAYEAEQRRAEQRGEAGTLGKLVAKTINLCADLFSVATDEVVKLTTNYGGTARSEVPPAQRELGTADPETSSTGKSRVESETEEMGRLIQATKDEPEPLNTEGQGQRGQMRRLLEETRERPAPSTTPTPLNGGKVEQIKRLLNQPPEKEREN